MSLGSLKHSVSKKTYIIVGISIGTLATAIGCHYIYKKYWKNSETTEHKHTSCERPRPSFPDEKKNLYIAFRQDYKHEMAPIFFSRALKAQKILKAKPDTSKAELKNLLYAGYEFIYEDYDVKNKLVWMHKTNFQEINQLDKIYQHDADAKKINQEIENLIESSLDGKFFYNVTIPKSLNESKFWLVFELCAMKKEAISLRAKLFKLEKSLSESELQTATIENELYNLITRMEDVYLDDLKFLETSLYPAEVVVLEKGCELEKINPADYKSNANKILNRVQLLVTSRSPTISEYREALDTLEKRQKEIQESLKKKQIKSV